MRFLKSLDFKLVLPAFFLLLVGRFILSSVAPGAYPEQFLHAGLAVVFFLLLANFDIRLLRALGPWLYALSLGLLLLTLVLGAVTRGSVRWIELGPLTLQPSEIVKPFLIVFFASLLAGRGSSRFLKAGAALLPAAALVVVQPDLGSTLVITAGFFGALLLSGVQFRYLGGLAAAGLIFSPILWGLLASYQKDRIIYFLNPSSDPLGGGYNSIQSMIAVGSGGFSGRGLGQGTQSQLAFLPERHTDFIFASLAEELGFLGAALVLVGFFLLFWRLVDITKRAPDSFSQALLGGIFALLFAQTAINIGMNLGILPITGIPLPFISSGGSSLVAMAATLGIASQVGSSLKDRGYLDILR